MNKFKETTKLIFSYLYYWFDRYGPILLPISAGILSFVSTYILFGPVLNRSGDNIYHLMNEYAMAHGVQAGDSIFGPLGMEMGQPVLRFYQSLFYLVNVVIHLFTDADLGFVHNITLCICFALSPLAYYYFMRKLKINKWTAGLASFMTLTSVAAFGNSFEAFFQAGIVTQAMGGLFFPWFMGIFVGMLRGENSPVTAGLFFALAFLSHAIMAVYATFVGALYFFLSESSVRHNFKKVIIFGAVGASIVAFWVIPFIEHNKTMRPVPDPIFRGSGVHWYTSVSSAELIDVASGGYMLDDASAQGNDRNEAEKFMDKINIIGSLSHRPPIFSLLTAFGILCALFQLRKLSVRFLLGGFAFSMMLFAGPDDFRWTSYLPFMDKVQAFRCTYLYEIFAFGLSALGVESTVGALFRFARKRPHWWSKVPFILVWAAAAAAVVGAVGYEIVRLGQTHLVVREPNILNQDLDALQNVPNEGYPWKVNVQTGGRPKIRHAWFAMHGFMPYCTHWKGTGPEIAFKLCSRLGDPKQFGALHAMSGVRYYTGWGPNIKKLQKLYDEDQVQVLHDIPVGLDRKDNPNSSRTTMENGFESFLRPSLAEPLPVVCNDKQWLWLANNWMARYRNRLFSEDVPMIMRLSGKPLAESGMLNRASAIFYFDHTDIDRDMAALQKFDKAGGIIVSPLEIADTGARVLEEMQSPWSALPPQMQNPQFKPGVVQREPNDPALQVAQIKMIEPQAHSYQYFAFDVETTEPILATIGLENYPGWKAYLDGEEIPVFSTGPDLVGVDIPEGVHRLKLQWEMPTRHRVMNWISLFGLLFVLFTWIRRIVLCTRDPRVRPTL